VARGGTIANVAVRAIPVDLHASSEFAQIAAYPATQRRGPRLIEHRTLRSLIAEKRCITTRCIVRCETGCVVFVLRHTCSDVAAAFERRDFRRARAGTPAPWRAPAGSCQRERDAHCRGVPSVLRGPLPWGQYRQVPFVVYKTPWINRIMIDSEVERSSTTRTSSGRWSALENADRVFQHEAPRDRAMRQLIRLLNPQLRAQRPLRGCLQGEFHAYCCYAGYRGSHL
jgi:hypothetical protein